LAYSVTATFKTEQAKIEGTQPINMYVVNSSQSGWDPLYYVDYNIDVYGFTLTSVGTVFATEVLYTGIPMKGAEVESNLQANTSDINITIPNTDRAIESLIQSNDYLRGRDVYILTFFAKHLPSGATSSHIGTSIDKNAGMKEKVYIDSVTSDENVVVFTCKPKFVINNIPLPNRRYSKECAWKYLATECDASSVISATTFPTCNYTLDHCRARDNEERFGGFPAIPRRNILIR